MLKKIFRQKKSILIWSIIIYFVVISILNSSWYRQKPKISTNLIKINDIQNSEINDEICQIPKLDYSMLLNNLPSKPKCQSERNWGTINSLDNKWTIDRDIESKIVSIKCKYRKVERIDDFKVNLGSFLELKNGDIVKDDVFEVECEGKNKLNNNEIKFNNLYVQVVDNNPNDKFNIDKDKTGCFPYNVMLLSYDSVSRVSFIKRLEKTYDLIKKTDNFFVLTGYNIVGDGTPAALIPIYTGYTEEELPSALKNDPNGKYVDEAYPFIWKELHQKNYTSIYLDDWPHVGAFTYRMRGFKSHTPKHYPKHFQLYMRQRHQKMKKANDFCNGDTKRHKIMMNLLTSFKQIYQNRQPNLAIMHYVENSHDSNDHLHWVDDEIFDFLDNGFKENLFDDTIIFLYSDHGSRFNKFRSSQRYLEERLPFFSVYFPDSFIKNNEQKLINFKNNIAKLTSPFDIHATVRDLTCSKKETQSDRERSISLFDKISVYRSCEDIGIPEHFCTCMRNWLSQDINSMETKNVSFFVVESINSITLEKRDLCQKLSLKKIVSSEKLEMANKILFRVSLITSPNNGIYETIIYAGKHKEFEFKSENFSIKSKNDISRIDSYGEQPWCVAKFGSNPGLTLDLRKFCFCFPRRRNK